MWRKDDTLGGAAQNSIGESRLWECRVLSCQTGLVSSRLGIVLSWNGILWLTKSRKIVARFFFAGADCSKISIPGIFSSIHRILRWIPFAGYFSVWWSGLWSVAPSVLL